jgi:hypothetical protein
MATDMAAKIDELVLRRRLSIKGLDMAMQLLFACFLGLFVVPMFSFDILPGRAGSGEVAIGVALLALLALILAILVKTGRQRNDLILSTTGMTQYDLWAKRFNWADYGPPKLHYIRSRHRPGRCLELKPIGTAATTQPLRIFDWYDADLDVIQNYIRRVRSMGSFGVVEPALAAIPDERTDRLKGPLNLALIVALMVSAVFNMAVSLDAFGIAEPVREMKQRAHDAFDPRPAQTILVIGNSRTSSNNMLGMLRALADADAYPKAIQFKMATINGSSFESQWATPRTRELLALRWDGAIVQGESRGQWDRETNQSFIDYGRKILEAIRLNGQARPFLIVNWCYDPSLLASYPDAPTRSELLARMQTDQLRLASQARARATNVGAVWEQVRTTMPSLALTTDGNHPTLAASYLSALMLYADLSGRNVSNNGYVPKGLDPATAAALRDEVQNQRDHRS